MPVLVYLLALAVFAQGTSEFMLAGLLPAMSRELNVSLGTAGLLTSGFAVGMVVGAPTMAVLVRALPAKSALLGFLAVFVAAHVIGALAPGFGLLLLSRVIAAVANAGFVAVAMSVIPRIVPPQRRARALAVMLGGTTLALIAGVPLGAWAGNLWGWRAVLWGVAAICLPALGALSWMGRTRDPRPQGATPSLRRELAALGSPELRRMIVLAVLANAAVFCSFTYLAVVAERAAGISAALIPLLLAGFGVGALCGVTLTGRFADKHWSGILSGGSIVAIVGWVSLAVWSQHAPVVWVVSGVMGMVSFLVGSTLISRVLAGASAAPTLGGAFSTAALNLGAVIGPILGGVALSLLGPPGPLWASAVCMIGAAVLWCRSPKDRAAPSTPEKGTHDD